MQGAAPTTTAENKRINNTLPVAREGFPFILSGIVLTGLFFIFQVPVPGALFCALTLFTVYFFRDPPRSAQVQEKAVLAPADGKVLDVTPIESSAEEAGEQAVKISIFMSLFDVHVNRIPTAGKISEIAYHPGKFLAANLDKASEVNERNTVTLQTGDGRKVVFVQVAGLIARRIACWVGQGDAVRAGQRFGLIRFGSRVDLFLPGDSRVVAAPGDKVKAGQTIIGYLP